MILGICSSPDVMKVARIINIIITIIKIVVPVILIVVSMITYMSLITSNDADISKANKTLVTRFIAAACIFFVPTFVRLIVDVIDGNDEYTQCLEKITISDIENAYEGIMDGLVSAAESEQTYDRYNSAKIYLTNIDDEGKRKSYSDRLEAVHEAIKAKEESEKPNNVILTDSIFIGDSRTVGMKSKTDTSCETTLAKSGGNITNCRQHIKEAKAMLSDDKYYNIVLNYGVNDLYNVNKYCTEYNDLVSSIDSHNKIFIVSINPVTDGKSGASNAGINTFNDKIKSCVSGDNVHYCDVHGQASLSTWNSGYVSGDGLHYTSKGYQFIYDNIKKCINGEL